MNTNEKGPEFMTEIGDPGAFGLKFENWENRCFYMRGRIRQFLAHGFVPAGCFPDGTIDVPNRPGHKERTNWFALLDGTAVEVRMEGRTTNGFYYVKIDTDHNYKRSAMYLAECDRAAAARRDQNFQRWLKQRVINPPVLIDIDDEGELA